MVYYCTCTIHCMIIHVHTLCYMYTSTCTCTSTLMLHVHVSLHVNILTHYVDIISLIYKSCVIVYVHNTSSFHKQQFPLAHEYYKHDIIL